MSLFFVDLCIIGAGPAGVMAALSAKKENPSASVLIVEASEEVAYRIGEALLTGTVISMAEVGIASEIASLGFHKKIGAAYVWGGQETLGMLIIQAKITTRLNSLITGREPPSTSQGMCLI